MHTKISCLLQGDSHQIFFLRCLFVVCRNAGTRREVCLLLGRICRAWREISLSTPRLWTSLHVTIPVFIRGNYITEGIELRTKGVEAWLAKSGPTLPLSISIYAPHDGSSQSPYFSANTVICLQTLFNCFAVHLHRCKAIELTMHAYFIKLFRDCMDSASPGWASSQLTNLDTFSLRALGPYNRNAPLCRLLGVPNLQHISWKGDIGDLKHYG